MSTAKEKRKKEVPVRGGESEKKGVTEAKHKQKEVPEEPVQEAVPEAEIESKPRFDAAWYKGSGKLEGKVALIIGGDSGIGRAVAVLFAREGASVAINFLREENKDAEETKAWVETKESGRCLLLPGNLRESKICADIVRQTVDHFGKLDILVNIAGTQFVVKDFSEVTEEQIREAFEINIMAMMLVTKEALKHLPDKTGAIINTTPVTAFRGESKLVDYSSTKGAILAFTRSLAGQLGERGIRVNAVAPGPIWTPLIPGSFPKEDLANWGKLLPLGRCGQPDECSPAFVFLASQDSSYFTGQTLNPNGGSIINV